jgi:hypothetical protein
MNLILYCVAILVVLPLAVSSFAPSHHLTHHLHQNKIPTIRQPIVVYFFGSTKVVPESERSDAESKPATYKLQGGEFGFSPEAIVRPLLKQTQLEKRKLQTVYNAKKDGWNARAFHQRVDGKGASVVLAKVKGQWIGGYNPRGWASLGGARSSVASFVFYQKLFGIGGWKKLRVSRTGSMACGRDDFDSGIYFGADALVIPLIGKKPRNVASRLGYYFECGPENKTTLLPVKAADATVDELYVVSGVYAEGEDIPNSGGVSELGFY